MSSQNQMWMCVLSLDSTPLTFGFHGRLEPGAHAQSVVAVNQRGALVLAPSPVTPPQLSFSQHQPLTTTSTEGRLVCFTHTPRHQCSTSAKSTAVVLIARTKSQSRSLAVLFFTHPRGCFKKASKTFEVCAFTVCPLHMKFPLSDMTLRNQPNQQN